MSSRSFRVLVPVAALLCGGAAAAPVTLRPPAVPLVAHDPYFSIWSPADRLTDADTVHWTGKPHRLTSLVRVDGRAFRLLGKEPADVPALPQAGVEVLPTRTICRFTNAQVRLTFTFLTPALPADLDVLARPVTYLAWEVAAADGGSHAVQLECGMGGELAVNTADQPVAWDRPAVDGFTVWRVGAQAQRVLMRKGDDLRIEWGYAYLAASAAQQPAAAGEGVLRFDLGPVGAAPVTRHALLAYDDLYAINYFGARLRPYWRRGGAEAADLLRAAERDYAGLAERCRAFDERLLADLRQVGGDAYAALCVLAYRQTFAGNKLAADANGLPLLFPKENFSNGCIATVDVLFPQAPFFLALSPALTKAMLVPILDYAASPRWPYGYAPHDLGTYPHATGQVYGMGGGDGGRMPVEESGNMLIMLAALARVEGNADLAKKYWPTLAKWADYLVANGLDPENQLCSADMFGHLPHCANLALKAIIGIGGYAQLCELAGKPAEAQKYLAVARDYAAQWQVKARDEGRTRLAYHQPGTWGMKHNLVWDRVLGTQLFPDAVGDAEVAWYLKVQKPFGLPVDNRTDTCLIDWAMWSMAPARNDADFQALVAPLFRYANETPSRVPLSDWFVTTDGRQRGFQARPVVGGLFIRLLTDAPVWRRWAGAAAAVSGAWAPLPVPPPAPTRVLVPTAEAQPVAWRYTLEPPAAGWLKPGFDAGAWREGPAGFGTAGTPGARVRTAWQTQTIWLRRAFTLAGGTLVTPQLRAHYDEDAEVYINGVLAANLTGWTTGYEAFPIEEAARAALHPGTNLFAVLCRQTTGGQYIDVGLVDCGTPPTARAAPPGPPPGLRKLMDTPLRDPSVCRGPDGTYYLTGTSEPFWSFNNTNGIRVWKSQDLATWAPLGTVWRYGASPWHAKYLAVKKPLWAPEIHYLKQTFWLTYSIPGWDGTGKTSGCGLLKSTTGKAEGPYEDVQPGERLGDEIDASLFEDDDGTVYFLWHSGKIARLKPDMSGLAEPYRWLRTTTTDPDPKHHSGLCAGIFGSGSFDHVGYEGMFLFKAGGRYLFCCSDMFEGRYSCAVSTSTNLFGPYGERYEAIPHGGHSAFFKDGQGQWFSTYFGPPWGERAAILPVEVTAAGRLQPAAAAAEAAPKLPADLKPLFDFPVRDTCVCRGPDGMYYLTGTTGHPTWWTTNDGIRVWKSQDLKAWEPLGLVWSFEKDATWQKLKGDRRAIWAPELHAFKGTFWIAYCVNYAGTGILRSKTGKAEGPYEDVKPDGPLTGEIDASLFADDDGKVYFVWQDGKIARLKDDMSGLAEPARLLKPANAAHVGFEGAFLTKINGRYHLIGAEFRKQAGVSTYDCMAASADALDGPYGDAYLAVPHGGHNMLFKDGRGNWWSTFFGNDPQAPFRERPGLLPIRVDATGKIGVQP